MPITPRGPASRRQVVLQLGDDLVANAGQGVAAVEESMDGDSGDLAPHPELDRCQQVLVDGVHPALAEQADQVQRPAGPAQLVGQSTRGAISKNSPDRTLWEIRTRSCGTTRPAPRFRWPDFGIAHLALGKPHGESAGVQEGARGQRPEALPDGGFAQGNGVSLALGTVAPAVEDDQRNWRPPTASV